MEEKKRVVAMPLWGPVAMSFGPVAMVFPLVIGIPVSYPVALIVVILGAVGVTQSLAHQHKRILQLEQDLELLSRRLENT